MLVLITAGSFVSFSKSYQLLSWFILKPESVAFRRLSLNFIILSKLSLDMSSFVNSLGLEAKLNGSLSVRLALESDYEVQLY